MDIPVVSPPEIVPPKISSFKDIVWKIKYSKFWLSPNKGRYLTFLFVLALLPATIFVVKYRTSYVNRASGEVSTNEALAANELRFTQTINSKYIGFLGNVTDVENLYNPIFESYMKWDKDAPTYFVRYGAYRGFCVNAVVNAVSKGKSLTKDDPFLQYFVKRWNSTEFRQIFPTNPTNVWFFLQPYTSYECMLATNLMRDQLKLIPGKQNPNDTFLNELLDDFSYAGRSMYSAFLKSPQGAVDLFTNNSRDNYGDTHAEEAGAVAVFYHTAAKLLPESGPGSITVDERKNWYDLSKAVFAWSYTKCDGPCSFRERYPQGSVPPGGNLWLVNNHQIENNPDYTLGIPHFYDEIAMVYNQLGVNIFTSLPVDIVTPAMRSATNNIANDMDKYIASDYSYKGPFNVVLFSEGGRTSRPDLNTTDTKTILASYDFANTKYTMIDSGKPNNISSSIPVGKTANISGFVLANANGTPTTTVKMYVENENHRWHYTCDLAPKGICKAEYQTENISDTWAGINKKPDNSDGWNANPPPGGGPGNNAIDAESFFYDPTVPGKLKGYVYKGNRGWHYTCESGVCTAQYTQDLNKFWDVNNKDGAGWVGENVPPNSDVDAVSQFVIPGTKVIKSYSIKGNRIWHFVVDLSQTDPQLKYRAIYTKTLTDYLSKYNLGYESIDSLVQYYLPDNKTLRALIVKDDKILEFNCLGVSVGDPNDNNVTCTKVSDKTLADDYLKIYYQFKWPQFKIDDPLKQRSGVPDWGRDATFQNASFAAFYVLNPSLLGNLERYQKLQNFEIIKGRDNGKTPFPINFENGQWNYDNFKGAVASGGYLMDGLRPLTDPDYQSVFPAQSAKPYQHWSLSMFAAECHAKAYLTLMSVANNSNLLAQFASQNAVVPHIETESMNLTATGNNKFIIENGYIYQPTMTGGILPSLAAKAEKTFSVPKSGVYKLRAKVNAPDSGSNSLYVNIDGEPTDPVMIWDILPIPTNGFVDKDISWRGTGGPDANQFNPKLFTLTAGSHNLTIRGREPVKLDYIEVIFQSDIPNPPSCAVLKANCSATLDCCSGLTCYVNKCVNKCTITGSSCTTNTTCCSRICNFKTRKCR
jgi:hypothetical protein